MIDTTIGHGADREALHKIMAQPVKDIGSLLIEIPQQDPAQSEITSHETQRTTQGEN